MTGKYWWNGERDDKIHSNVSVIDIVGGVCNDENDANSGGGGGSK